MALICKSDTSLKFNSNMTQNLVYGTLSYHHNLQASSLHKKGWNNVNFEVIYEENLTW